MTAHDTEDQVDRKCGNADCGVTVRVTYVASRPQPMDDGGKSIDCPKCKHPVLMFFHGEWMDVDYVGSDTCPPAKSVK